MTLMADEQKAGLRPSHPNDMMVWQVVRERRSWSTSSSPARRPDARSTAGSRARSAPFCASGSRASAPGAPRAANGTTGRCATPSWPEPPPAPAPTVTSPDSCRGCAAPHDVEREVRHLVDHEAEFALIDQREFARLLDTRG